MPLQASNARPPRRSATPPAQQHGGSVRLRRESSAQTEPATILHQWRVQAQQIGHSQKAHPIMIVECAGSRQSCSRCFSRAGRGGSTEAHSCQGVVVAMFRAWRDTAISRASSSIGWSATSSIVSLLSRRASRSAHERGGVLSVLTGVAPPAPLPASWRWTDPRFDLTKRTGVAGIAGVDPADASLGSAPGPEWVVDGDLRMRSTHAKSGWLEKRYVPLRKSVPSSSRA